MDVHANIVQVRIRALGDTDTIHSFLAESRWKDRFDDEILAAANTFVPKVRELKISAPSADSITVSGVVGGEESEVDLWKSGGDWDFETSCNCEVGMFCHHAAALLTRAAKERDVSRLVGRVPVSEVAAALPTARDLMKNPPEDLPRLKFDPRFELHVTRQPADRATRLLLQSLGQAEPEFWISAEATAVYDKHRSSLRSAAPEWITPITQASGEPAMIQHDAGAEAAAAQQLRDTGLSSLQSNSSWRFLLNLKAKETGSAKAPDRWFPDPGRIPTDAFWQQFRGEMVVRLEESGWKVTVDDSVGHRVFDADPDRWDTSLTPGDGGWFSLSVGFDVAGKSYDLLPILAGLLENAFLEETLDRPDNGHVYAPLPSGDALRLPIGRVRKILHHLAALIDPKFPDKARLHALDAASLAGLDGLGIETPPDLAELASKLHDFSGIDAVPQPAGIKATLRDYQLAGFHWMQFLARHGLHGILADDMGLGKTLQTLTHILAEKHSGHSRGLPALVIAPTSVVPNWRAEAMKFAPDLRVLVLNGPERKKYFRSIPHADLVLTSFALLQRDIEKLAAVPFHLVVLDEAQHIKNPRSKVAQAACKLEIGRAHV